MPSTTRRSLLTALSAAALLVAGAAWAGESAPKQAPDFTLPGADGTSYKLSDHKGKIVVLEWVNYGCPFVRKHYDSQNMQTLQRTYRDSGVVWLSICSSAPGKQGYFEGQALTDRIEQEGAAATAYLIDADGAVGKAYGARTTPHMYVIDRGGNLVYAGGIDDVRSANVDDIARATNYVAAALDALLEGRPVPQASSTPYGCSVKYAD